MEIYFDALKTHVLESTRTSEVFREAIKCEDQALVIL